MFQPSLWQALRALIVGSCIIMPVATRHHQTVKCSRWLCAALTTLDFTEQSPLYTAISMFDLICRNEFWKALSQIWNEAFMITIICLCFSCSITPVYWNFYFRWISQLSLLLPTFNLTGELRDVNPQSFRQSRQQQQNIAKWAKYCRWHVNNMCLKSVLLHTALRTFLKAVMYCIL